MKGGSGGKLGFVKASSKIQVRDNKGLGQGVSGERWADLGCILLVQSQQGLLLDSNSKRRVRDNSKSSGPSN